MHIWISYHSLHLSRICISINLFIYMYEVMLKKITKTTVSSTALHIFTLCSRTLSAVLHGESSQINLLCIYMYITSANALAQTSLMQCCRWPDLKKESTFDSHISLEEVHDLSIFLYCKMILRPSVFVAYSLELCTILFTKQFPFSLLEILKRTIDECVVNEELDAQNSNQ